MWRCMAARSLPSLLGLVGVMRLLPLGLARGVACLPWLGLHTMRVLSVPTLQRAGRPMVQLPPLGQGPGACWSGA